MLARRSLGKRLPKDPTRPITAFKTAWTKVRKKAGIKGRWQDNRHTLVTELAESGAGDEVIMSIARHVSLAMLSRHILQPNVLPLSGSQRFDFLRSACAVSLRSALVRFAFSFFAKTFSRNRGSDGS
jgi:hypothetical protein